MIQEQLKPCPWCKGHNLHPTQTGVQCRTCKATGPWGHDADPKVSWTDKSKALWNDRLSDGLILDMAGALRRLGSAHVHKDGNIDEAVAVLEKAREAGFKV